MNDCYWCALGITHKENIFIAPATGDYLSIECLDKEIIPIYVELDKDEQYYTNAHFITMIKVE